MSVSALKVIELFVVLLGGYFEFYSILGAGGITQHNRAPVSTIGLSFSLFVAFAIFVVCEIIIFVPFVSLSFVNKYMWQFPTVA